MMDFFSNEDNDKTDFVELTPPNKFDDLTSNEK
jgi:hypothetical protein